jgi:hypothetical protein
MWGSLWAIIVLRGFKWLDWEYGHGCSIGCVLYVILRGIKQEITQLLLFVVQNRLRGPSASNVLPCGCLIRLSFRPSPRGLLFHIKAAQSNKHSMQNSIMLFLGYTFLVRFFHRSGANAVRMLSNRRTQV